MKMMRRNQKIQNRVMDYPKSSSLNMDGILSYFKSKMIKTISLRIKEQLSFLIKEKRAFSIIWDKI